MSIAALYFMIEVLNDGFVSIQFSRVISIPRPVTDWLVQTDMDTLSELLVLVWGERIGCRWYRPTKNQ